LRSALDFRTAFGQATKSTPASAAPKAAQAAAEKLGHRDQRSAQKLPGIGKV
jgi:hypothetical protein